MDDNQFSIPEKHRRHNQERGLSLPPDELSQKRDRGHRRIQRFRADPLSREVKHPPITQMDADSYKEYSNLRHLRTIISLSERLLTNLATLAKVGAVYRKSGYSALPKVRALLSR